MSHKKKQEEEKNTESNPFNKDMDLDNAKSEAEKTEEPKAE